MLWWHLLMKRLLVIFALVFAALALTFFPGLPDDFEYRAKEAISFGRYKKHDALIQQASQRYGVPPELIKAVIWRESRFQPRKVGAQGERGLMQITENAAADWALAEKIETFAPTDLFDPKVNIEAGTWYLKRALAHWSAKDNPVPFALAEYNAGRTRVKKWVKNSGRGETAGAEDLQTVMDFPMTKSYITSIVTRSDFYVKRGEFPAK